ncbi:MAG TPA: ShlB/FhaC/HecB family hemolysin secretion/activation protein, partial [Steroidobacteraceae bacterium]
LSASRSEAVPDLGADFAAYNLETSSDDASVRVDVPLRRSRARNLTYFARLTRHDGETESLLFAERSADRISAFRTGFTFDSAGPRRGVNIVEVEYSQGLDAFDASKITDENLSRPGGDPEFSKLTLYAARLQSIRGRWSMLFALTAQKAFDNLLGPEEFGFGGEYFGRAYDPSEIVGDQGAAAKMEIRYTWYTSRGSGLTAYTFWDVGEVRQRLAESEVVTKTSDSAASAGLGLRFNLGRNVTGYVESATPLTQSVVAEGTDDTRVFGGIRVRF